MSNMINRRDFLKQTAVAGVGLSLAGGVRSLAQSADNKVRVAVIGTHGRGLAHIECLTKLPDTEITYICDVDDRAIASGIKATLKQQASKPKGEKDFRKVLEDKSIDAITIATPDHWHAPMAIMGLAAGKHVYVEKPCSHNPHEGELLIAAVAKFKRICQMGNQRRSFPNLQSAIQQVHEGALGKTCFAKGWYVANRPSIGVGKPEAVPEWLDYELWQGPAPRRPYRSNLIHYNWHWFWHWGTGEALNNGTHEIDVCRWALGVDWPTKITSSGGRYYYQDDWETPDTQVIGWEYPGGKSISWEGRSCNKCPVDGLARGVMIYGTKGSALLDSNSYTFWDANNKVIKCVKETAGADANNTTSATGAELDRLHFANFLDAIRDGKALNSPIPQAHKSVAMLHLGNIAQRVGRTLNIDPTNGHILNDSDAMKLWGREYEPGWNPKV